MMKPHLTALALGLAVLWGAPSAAENRFLGSEGELLPFDEDALLSFLENASVVESEEVAGGIGRTLKVLLEQDGIRAHAAFRTIDRKVKKTILSGETYLDFHDSYIYEVAAYRLSRLLEIDMVPPAVLRSIDGEAGSIQLWIPDAMTDAKRRSEKLEAPDKAAWYEQEQTKRLFDRLIYNYDRHANNVLIADWRLWLIDHTRSFRLSTNMPGLKEVTGCSRGLYQRLQTMDQELVRRELKPVIGGARTRAVFKRRAKVVKHCESLAQNLGEDNAFFD